jgi:hypothetical protein
MDINENIEYLKKKADILENELLDLKKKISDMEDAVKTPEPPNKRWRAEKGDTYFYVALYGGEAKTDMREPADDDLYETGNYFETIQEANFEYERLKVLNELCQWVTPYRAKASYGFYPHISSTTKRYVIDIVSSSSLPPDVLRFESKNTAKNAIKAVGEDRILKYYYRLNIDEEN